MRPIRWLTFTAIIFLSACQPSNSPIVTIIDDDKITTLQTDERVPLALLNQAGLTLNPNDRILLNGIPIAHDQSLSNSLMSNSLTTLQIRRAANVLIITLEGQQTIQTSAFTVGEVLQEANTQLQAGDKIDPPINSPVSTQSVQSSNSPFTIYYLPARILTINVNAQHLPILSSAETIGEALAEAGIPLMGLHYSLPSGNEALPSDGQIKVVRVSESVLLAQKPIPFESELEASADVPLDQTQILQPGENGLTVQRIRIRYEDGNEISRVTEDETLVRPPKTRLLGYGTKIEIKTAVVDGVEIEYWRAVQMYATSYSPCRSGTDECHGGTASGQTLKKGMAGLRHNWYLSMQGQRLYIPGYGFSSVEDVCGGCVGKPWIDLGYSDNDYEPWSTWVTVYFLTPVPANVIYVLE
ncbi:MAG: ubiquitin-like domain-containing protein [Anaerolineae bacterium]|nr:ubiquitin-like domain-containing protein [Anaerolineae bacterium]MCI0609718.1 ubiquitin-like domain-containing protein [Anaerolineae bacterium]